jgi:ATP-dependent helicase/nuclease subunit B
MAPRVYTLPAGTDFAAVLACGLLAQYADQPQDLGRLLLLLPNRRACVAVADAFLEAKNGATLILPRMQPVGDVDLKTLLPLGLAADDPSLVPPIGALHRDLLLARMIQAMPSMTVAQSLHLARDLARWLDQAHSFGVDPEALETLVPDHDLAGHWQQVMTFLRLITREWPKILGSYGLCDRGDYQTRLMTARAAQWQDQPPPYAVMIAGSTGSVPATRKLMQVIAQLPQGSVLLPALDHDLDELAWAAIKPDHHQYILRETLTVLGLRRQQVDLWPYAQPCDTATDHPAMAARRKMLSRAMTPADSALAWHRDEVPAEALAGLKVLEVMDREAEAATIAIMLREDLAQSQARTALVITPDPILAAQIQANMARWDVTIDSSFSTPLAQTLVGQFVLAVLRWVAAPRQALGLVEILRHPLCSVGHDLWRRHIEERLLRGKAYEDLVAAIADFAGQEDPQGIMAPLTADLARILAEMVSPITQGQKQDSFIEWLRRLIAMLEALTAPVSDGGPSVPDYPLWRGEAGCAMAAFFETIMTRLDAEGALSVAFGDCPVEWAEALSILIGHEKVYGQRRGGHPRLKIASPIEARLLSADHVILASLNEGLWPSAVDPDPWMSQAMRASVGLPVNALRLGQSAHDFYHHAAAVKVTLVRAQKIDGVPSTPSRWWVRLNALLRASHGDNPPSRPLLAMALIDQPILYQRALSKPQKQPPKKALGLGRPPVAARPRSLSASSLSLLEQNPYAFYAKHVLGLRPLESFDPEFDARAWGNFVHAVFEEAAPLIIARAPFEALGGVIENNLSCHALSAGEKEFMYARLEHLYAWLCHNRQSPFRDAATVTTEHEMTAVYNLGPSRTAITVHGIADGMLVSKSGAKMTIIDYKTGSLPSGKKGQDWQIPTLLWLAAQDDVFGKFQQDAGAYVVLTAKEGKIAEVKPVLPEGAAFEERLSALLEPYYDQNAPRDYTIAGSSKHYSHRDYGHLMRVAQSEDEDDDDGSEADPHSQEGAAA